MSASLHTVWNEEERQLLTKMWPTNSSGVIAERLGRTRNAIIGMARRMQLPPKIPGGKPRSAAKSTVVTRAPPSRVRVTIKSKPAAQPDLTKGIPLLEASSSQCKAIIESSTDPKGLAMVCGQPVPLGRFFSFCDYHLARYTTKSTRGSGHV